MSHDTDKLIRQLSLVAFLMAERRPITARDVKQNVEGYSEMSDEAFARRFYSDRAELLSLGVPLDSQRDEFTGEELYTLRSERYFLPPLELSNEELAALQTCLSLLDGQFAYAEPLRLALQNLALGRPGFDEAPTDTALRVNARGRDYSPELPGRLAKLEERSRSSGR
jgi:predicted DNA-binding transcriptional regulator YafY